MAQVARVYNTLAGRLKGWEESTAGAVKRLYENDEELKQGLSASEFNLRAHQKVLNAMALELEQMRTFMLALLPESPTKEALQERILQMAEVTLPPEEEGGEPNVVRRVNWPYYHEQVESDLKILAELEAKRLAEEKAQAEAEAAKKAEEEKQAQQEIAEAEVVLGGEEGDEELPPELGDDESEAKEEEPQAGAPQEDDGVPEGAVVFGGS